MEQIINYNILLLLFSINLITGQCPKFCDCKWKNGKDSVFCINSNLTKIPTSLDHGTQVLDLTGNDLKKIYHDSFNNIGLINLQKIYLIKCKIKLLERYGFRKLNNLVELDLSYNLLTDVPTHIFDNINELRELKLNGNPITKITNDAFNYLPQLLRLELSNCKINVIERNAFNGIEKKLEWLKLDGNKLNELITTNTLTTLNNLNGLELYKNPWNCSCKLRPLKKWLIQKKLTFTLSPVCMYPERLKSKLWEKLTLDEFTCIPKIINGNNGNKLINTIEGKNLTLNCFIKINEDGVDDYEENYYDYGLVGSTENNNGFGGGGGGVGGGGGSAYLKNNNEIVIKWKFKNKLLTEGSKIRKYIFNKKQNGLSLTVIATDTNDNGLYTCIVHNKAGKIEENFYVKIIKVNLLNNLTNYRYILFIVIVVVILIFLLIILVLLIKFFVIKKRYSKKSNQSTIGQQSISLSGAGSGVCGGSGVSGNGGGDNNQCQINQSTINCDYEKVNRYKIGNGNSSNQKLTASKIFSGGSSIGSGNISDYKYMPAHQISDDDYDDCNDLDDDDHLLIKNYETKNRTIKFTTILTPIPTPSPISSNKSSQQATKMNKGGSVKKWESTGHEGQQTSSSSSVGGGGMDSKR